MNQLTIAGVLAEDAQIKTTQSGKQYIAAIITVSKKGFDGKTWSKKIEVESFGRSATDAAISNLTAGATVWASGEADARAFMGREGKPVARMKIIGQIGLIAVPDGQGDSGPMRSTRQGPPPAATPVAQPEEDDVPF